MDVDAFVLAHRPTWNRLEELVKRRRRLTGAEVDELVDLYQRVSTHLSMVRSASGDSVLVGRLSSLVARARSAVTSAHAPLWSEFVRFWTVSFPVAAYRSWRWWVGDRGRVLRRHRGHRDVGGGQPRGAGNDRNTRRDRTISSTTSSPTTTARTPRRRSRCRCGPTTRWWPPSASRSRYCSAFPSRTYSFRTPPTSASSPA